MDKLTFPYGLEMPQSSTNPLKLSFYLKSSLNKVLSQDLLIYSSLRLTFHFNFCIKIDCQPMEHPKDISSF